MNHPDFDQDSVKQNKHFCHYNITGTYNINTVHWYVNTDRHEFSLTHP